ncbi:MAG: alpha/beta fold hydrolase [Deltaproteobacteria bacterium]|nr:alpha/beta fold hydrolase [Deltaproteobacteria bacterium]
MGALPLHVTVEGAGTPLVLLHAFPFCHTLFEDQRPLAAGALLVRPDLRGFGRSPQAATATMEEMAADVLEALDRLKLDRVVLGGISMGGYVALALLRLDPSRVRGLVLMDTQALADDEAGRAARGVNAARVEQEGTAFLVDGLLERLLSPACPEDTRREVEHRMRAESPAAVAAALRGMAVREDSRDVLHRYGGPLLVMVGEQDVVTPPDRARQMAELVPGAVLVQVPGAGHLPNVEKPALVNEALASFVARC